MAKINKKTKRLLLNLAFVALLIIITLVVLIVNQKELNFKSIGEYFRSCNAGWIVCAFVCMLLFIFFEALSLFFLGRFFGHKTRLHSAVAYASADTFYSAITPTAAGGQPASVYYMTRDGMSAGKASFAMLFNVICYTGAIFVIGLMALCIDPTLFGGINTVFAKVLVIAGAVIQAVLLGFFIGCMFFGKAIKKIGNGLVNLLTKIKIVKNPDKWRTKIEEEVDKYSECRKIIKTKPIGIFTTIICNVLQRVAQTLIPCFVCLAAMPDAPFWDIFVLQALLLFGYNAVPIPGGVGAYEYLFINIYAQMYPNAFILVVLMISRFLSYYISMLISGVYTLVYHMVKVKKVPAETAAEDNAPLLLPDAQEDEVPAISDEQDAQTEQEENDGQDVQTDKMRSEEENV